MRSRHHTASYFAQLIAISLIAILAFTWWTAAPTFSDPDSFYHIKIAQLIRDNGAPITDFPWMQYATIGQRYVDHHFLYHVALIPFISALDPILGMKLATIGFGALAIILFFIILQRWRVPYPFIWALVLLSANPFVFRIGLAKAPAISFLFLFGGFILLVHRHYGALFLLSFFFVWSYGGFLLLPLLALVYCTTLFILNRKKKYFWREPLQLFATVAVGTIAGLCIHPYFPLHLQLFWEQLVQIGIINYSDAITVGAEWSAATIGDQIARAPQIWAVAVYAAGFALWARKRLSARTISACIFALGTIAFTAKSQRYIEYAVPWTLLASLLLLRDTHGLTPLKRAPQWFRALPKKPLSTIALFVLFLGYSTWIIAGVGLYQVRSTASHLHDGIPTTHGQAVSLWLQQNTNPGELVFHSDWDIFPELFYYNTHNTYIIGLDPTFMLLYNPEAHEQWVNITTGKGGIDTYDTIVNTFGSRVVLIEQENTAMQNLIQQDSRFKRVYQDSEYLVFTADVRP